METATTPETARTTVNQLLDRYVAEILPTLSERTRNDYSRYIIPRLRTKWGERVADEIKPREFGEYLWQSPRGRIQRTRELAPLAAAYTAGFGKWWMVETRPIHGIDKPKSKARRHLITPAEYQAMAKLAPYPIRLAMGLALLTGQRQGDILSLEWSMIHGGKIHFVQGKTGKELGIRLSSQIKRVLGKCTTLPGQPCEYVISSRNGTRYTSEGFRAMFTRMQRQFAAQGGRRARFHDIRRMAGSMAGSLKAAQELLGHEDSKMTAKHYYCVEDESDPLTVGFEPV